MNSPILSRPNILGSELRNRQNPSVHSCKLAFRQSEHLTQNTRPKHLLDGGFNLGFADYALYECTDISVWGDVMGRR